MKWPKRSPKKGISVEVIDLRTIVPLDFDTVLASIRKTGKLLIAHEAARNCGFGAELAARADRRLSLSRCAGHARGR